MNQRRIFQHNILYFVLYAIAFQVIFKSDHVRSPSQEDKPSVYRHRRTQLPTHPSIPTLSHQPNFFFYYFSPLKVQGSSGNWLWVVYMSGAESLSLKNSGSFITRYKPQIQRNVKYYFQLISPCNSIFPFFLLDTQHFQGFGEALQQFCFVLFFFLSGRKTFSDNLIKCITYC